MATRVDWQDVDPVERVWPSVMIRSRLDQRPPNNRPPFRRRLGRSLRKLEHFEDKRNCLRLRRPTHSRLVPRESRRRVDRRLRCEDSCFVAAAAAVVVAAVAEGDVAVVAGAWAWRIVLPKRQTPAAASFPAWTWFARP